MLRISEIFVCGKVRCHKIEFHASRTMDLDPAHWEDHFKHIKPYHYPGGCQNLTLGQKDEGDPADCLAASSLAAVAAAAAAWRQRGVGGGGTINNQLKASAATASEKATTTATTPR
jgi:hypothetical protein